METEKQGMKSEMDVDDVLATSPQHLRKKVGIAFDDDGAPTSGFVIVGKDSDEYRKCANDLRATGIRRQANKRTRIDTKTEEGALEFAEVIQQNEFELACSVIVDWFGFTRNGELMAFDKSIARRMLEARQSWAQRISAELENEDGFLKLSPANSAISRAQNSLTLAEERTA
jgi:hypothetical protein